MDVVYAKGLVLSIENLPKEGTTMQAVKDFFSNYKKVAYCVYEDGDDKVFINSFSICVG